MFQSLDVVEGGEVAAVDDDFNEHDVILNIGVLPVLLGVQHAEGHELGAATRDVHHVLRLLERRILIVGPEGVDDVGLEILVVEQQRYFLLERPAEETVVRRAHDDHKEARRIIFQRMANIFFV